MDTHNKTIDDIRSMYLVEYNTLREESLRTLNNRIQIVSFGLATLGLLFAGILSSKTQNDHLIGVVFGVVIPIISTLVYYFWFGEFERMVRVGKKLQRVETAINSTFKGKPILTWETELEEIRMKYPYISAASIFLGIALLSPLVGFIYRGVFGAFYNEIIKFPTGGAVAFFAVIGASFHTGWRYLFKFPKTLNTWE